MLLPPHTFGRLLCQSDEFLFQSSLTAVKLFPSKITLVAFEAFNITALNRYTGSHTWNHNRIDHYSNNKLSINNHYDSTSIYRITSTKNSRHRNCVLRILWNILVEEKEKKNIIPVYWGDGDWFSSLGSLTGLMDWMGELCNNCLSINNYPQVKTLAWLKLLPSHCASTSTGKCVEIKGI